MKTCKVCKTKLNSYNRTRYCGAHQRMRVDKADKHSMKISTEKAYATKG